MQDLSHIRDEIDKIDEKMLKLFVERMDCAVKVAQYKQSTGMQIFDPVREAQILKKRVSQLEDETYKSEVHGFFSSLMDFSKQVQWKCIDDGKGFRDAMLQIPISSKAKISPTVVYHGLPGCYAHEASCALFSDNEKILSINTPTFEGVFAALSSGECDYAVVPLENSSTGSILEVFDLLAKYDCYIVAEKKLEIKHCLLGAHDADILGIKEVYSHSQSLMQCDDFLKEHSDWAKTAYGNNAKSAKFVADSEDKTKVAIAGRAAAELYGLKVLAHDINSNAKNTTRFVVLSKTMEVDDNSNKVSVSFTLPHVSGSLFRAFSYFAMYGINLLNVETRPVKDANWVYMFFVDIAGNINSVDVERAVSNVMRDAGVFRMIGNYQADN